MLRCTPLLLVSLGVWPTYTDCGEKDILERHGGGLCGPSSQTIWCVLEPHEMEGNFVAPLDGGTRHMGS